MLNNMHGAAIDLSRAPLDVVIAVLQTMPFKERFTCALVCKAWAEAATAATRSISLKNTTGRQLRCLQRWLENHGNHIEVLQLYNVCGDAVVAALPCAALQDLLLHGTLRRGNLRVGSGVWGDIAAATKLTSVSLQSISTASRQADVVSALTALPDLQHLTWSFVPCSGMRWLSDSVLLQQLTKLTSLELWYATAAALQHLGSLTKLQHLTIASAEDWAAAGCPGLQELKALTSLDLARDVELKALKSLKLVQGVDDVPTCVSQLTALQQLGLSDATPAALSRLQPLTLLTHLSVKTLRDMSAESPPLQLPGIQHLEPVGNEGSMPKSYLASCTQLRVLSLSRFTAVGQSRAVVSTMLQRLVLDLCCSKSSEDDGAIPWQQVFPGPGQLPHLTSLQLTGLQPDLQHSDIERIVCCCSSLQALQLDTWQDNFTPVLVPLSGFTCLHLERATDQQCSSLAQLTGLWELRVTHPGYLSRVGLQELVALEQLTSLSFTMGSSHDIISRELQGRLFDKAPGCARALINKAPAGCPPDVSAQLQRACDIATATGLCRYQDWG